MKKLLITGFDPFGGQNVNPASKAVMGLPDRIGDRQLIKMEIPTVFELAAQTVIKAAEQIKPDVILCIGQAGGRAAITPEVYGVNLRHARIEDNAGHKPQCQPIIMGAPGTYQTTVPVAKMVGAARSAGVPSTLSYTAGRFVCNDLLYTLLHRYYGTSVRVGFVHVPYMPEQAVNGEPCMPLEDVERALSAMISVL